MLGSSLCRTSLAVALALVATACAGAGAPETESAAVETAPVDDAGLERAIFAGGCFWCMEPPFDELEGVVATTSGYAGGPERNPTYKQVAYGLTGHTEVVEVLYDPEKIGYRELLDVFWRNIDPLTKDAQFCDKGSQYRTAIFFGTEKEGRLARESKEMIEQSGILNGPIVTEILPAGDFWPAEEYHQDFYKKNPDHYKRYRTGCGRDRTLRRIWGDG